MVAQHLDRPPRNGNQFKFFLSTRDTRQGPIRLRQILNQKLTSKIADYHVEAFDKLGSLYYSEEDYDDFYYGKGSAYPDINGGIGILFEQASSRGHLQESDNGLLSFPFTIRNQLTAAFLYAKGSNLAAERTAKLTLQTFYADGQGKSAS